MAKGVKSLNIMFDLFLDEFGAHSIAFAPRELEKAFYGILIYSKMEIRKSLLDDSWGLEEGGYPASIFFSLAESHGRVETCPEDSMVRGEVELCDHSRDNTATTKEIVRNLVSCLNPSKASFILTFRGPGVDIKQFPKMVWKRGEQMPF